MPFRKIKNPFNVVIQLLHRDELASDPREGQGLKCVSHSFPSGDTDTHTVMWFHPRGLRQAAAGFCGCRCAGLNSARLFVQSNG